jgi:hypothetical protein
MATAAELTITVAALEERVKNHIKFFWVVVAFGFAWLGAITVLLIQTKGTVATIAQAQANTPVRIVANLLSGSTTSISELAANLNATSTILQTARVGPKKPDPAALQTVSSKLAEAQNQHPDLPQVWQATSAFINYRSEITFPNTLRLLEFAKPSNCKASFGQAQDGVFTVTFTFCDLAIDGSPQNASYARFVNSIVHYSGGPIWAQKVILQNCILRFEVPSVPSREGVLAMRQLTTAADDANVTLSLPKG